MVVGFASGGISDVLARAIAAKVSLHIGQQVIVDNKPGAGTTIAGDMVAQAAPDGYTIWFEDITSYAFNAWLYSRLPYDSEKLNDSQHVIHRKGDPGLQGLNRSVTSFPVSSG